VNFFDTAPKYGNGLSEHRLGLALQGVPRNQYVLSSKVGWLVTTDGKQHPDYSAEGVLRSISDSLERLGVDHLDIVHIHDADAHEHEALEQTLPTLVSLRSQGVVKAIGAGMNQWQMLERFALYADFDCFMLAGRYTLLEQSALGFLDLCFQKQMAVFLGGVFNSGVLATGARPNAKYQYQNAPVEVLKRVAELEHVCSLHQIDLKSAALHFALAHPAVSSVVVGAVSTEELSTNYEALLASIPFEFWEDLRLRGLIPANAPTDGRIYEQSKI
jgi:D-threo-aldose 1-dehydrogenase